MSSCAAFCSTCCRPVSCASATSVSSPTATALRSCRYASNSSAAQRRSLLRRRHRPPIRLTHSGTARSAAQPCASSNGSPLRNSCFARHLNQTGARHEALSTSSASARASARTQTPCLIWPRRSGRQPLQPSTARLIAPRRRSIPHSSHRSTTRPSALPDPSASKQTHSKYIAFHEGGFLQVAVSEAPR